MDEFVVYVLYSLEFDRLYIGYSSVSIERFHWHNTKANKGFTTRYRPWIMLHIEFFSSKSEALKREKELKGGQGRNFIRTTILPCMKSAGFISA